MAWREKKERAIGSVTGMYSVGHTHHMLLPRCHLTHNSKFENTKKLFSILITHFTIFWVMRIGNERKLGQIDTISVGSTKSE